MILQDSRKHGAEPTKQLTVGGVRSMRMKQELACYIQSRIYHVRCVRCTCP